MTWIRTIPPAEAGGELKRVYEIAAWHLSAGVPYGKRSAPPSGRQFRQHCRCAQPLAQRDVPHISAHAALIQPDMPLTRRQQEMISTVVSALNGCFY